VEETAPDRIVTATYDPLEARPPVNQHVHEHAAEMMHS
jgi:hypothetical protein